VLGATVLSGCERLARSATEASAFRPGDHFRVRPSSDQNYRASNRGSFSQASKARGTDASDANLTKKYLFATTAQSLTNEAYWSAGNPMLPVVCRIASAHSLFISQTINHPRAPTMSSAPAVKPEISFADREVISSAYQMGVRQQSFANVLPPPFWPFRRSASRRQPSIRPGCSHALKPWWIGALASGRESMSPPGTQPLSSPPPPPKTPTLSTP